MNNRPNLHIFGEVLFDNFPDGSSVLGGAPFNVAWHLQAFGQCPRMISRIGDDLAGHEITALMAAWGMCCDGVSTDYNYATGTVEVQLENGEPSYNIIYPCAYDFIGAEVLAPEATQGVLYHGSLAQRHPVSKAALATMKARHQGKIFIDINLRDPWWEQAAIVSLLRDADWVKLNDSELLTLIPETTEIKHAMELFCLQFDPEILVVTCGAEGAIACDRGQQFFQVMPAADVAVVDTVGAGDGFAAVLLLGFIHQWPLQQTLERAQAFASALVTRRGATVANVEFYRTFCRQWGLLC